MNPEKTPFAETAHGIRFQAIVLKSNGKRLDLPDFFGYRKCFVFNPYDYFRKERWKVANHKSALKRAGQNTRRRLRNKIVQTRVKNAVKAVRLAASENLDDRAEILNAAKSNIAKAAKKGVLHRRTASRKISRLARLVGACQA